MKTFNWHLVHILLENLDDDEYFYHATYGSRMRSIKKYGIMPGKKKNWQESKSGVVYLAKDPHVAYSYAETSDNVPDEWLDDIKVLKVKKTSLDSTKIHKDTNVLDGAGETVEYHGIIPPESLTIHKFK